MVDASVLCEQVMASPLDLTLSDPARVAIALTNTSNGRWGQKMGQLMTDSSLLVPRYAQLVDNSNLSEDPLCCTRSLCAPGLQGCIRSVRGDAAPTYSWPPLSLWHGVFRYGCTQDAEMLNPSVRTLKSLFPEAEVVYQAPSRSEVAVAASDPIEIRSKPVEFPAIKLGTPKGVTRSNTVSPNTKPPDEIEYAPGRIVLCSVIVSVLKCTDVEGTQSEVLVPLEPGVGVTEEATKLVVWRHVRVPSPFTEFTVGATNSLPLMTVDLPMADTIFAVESQLRKRKEHSGETGPPVKCDNWCCYTQKYDYNTERTAIETLTVGHDCTAVPSSGRMTLCLKQPMCGSQEEPFQPGTYILRLRGHSLAGISKWSRIKAFDILRPGQPAG